MQVTKSKLKIDQKIFCLIVIIVFVIFVFTADGHRHSPDEVYALEQTQRIVSFEPNPLYVQDESHYGFDHPAEKMPWTQPICYNGILCSTVAIGYTLTQVPFMAINAFVGIIDSDSVIWTTDDFNDAHYVWWRNSLDSNSTFTELTYGPFFSAMTAGVFFLLCRTFNFSRNNSILLSLFLAFGTIVWAYSQTSLNVVPAMFFNLLGIFFLRKFFVSGTPKNMLFCGISLGFAYLVRMDAILFSVSVLPFLTYHIIKKLDNSVFYKTKILLYFVIPVVSSGIIVKFIDFIRFGYSYVAVTSQVQGVSTDYPWIAPGLFSHEYPLWLGGLGLLLAPGAGLLIFAPILFTIFLSFPDFFKKHKRECLIILTIVGLILIFYGTQSRWHGFVGWGARYLLIATPLLLLPLGATLEKRNGPSLKVILVVLVSFGLFINVIYVSQDVVWFIWGDAFTGRNGLYLVDKIDGIRDDLNLDRATMWSLKYSQITHSMTYFFSLLQPDIFMLKVLGNSFYALTVTVLTSIPAYFLLKLTKSVAINHNRNE